MDPHQVCLSKLYEWKYFRMLWKVFKNKRENGVLIKSQVISIFFDYSYLLPVDSQILSKKFLQSQFDVFVLFSFFDVFSVTKILTRKLSKMRSHRKSKVLVTFSCWTNCQTYMCFSKILCTFSVFWAFSQVLSTRLDSQKPISSLWLVVMPRTVKLSCWESYILHKYSELLY